MDTLETIKEDECKDISYADMYQMAGVVGIEVDSFGCSISSRHGLTGRSGPACTIEIWT